MPSAIAVRVWTEACKERPRSRWRRAGVIGPSSPAARPAESRHTRAGEDRAQRGEQDHGRQATAVQPAAQPHTITVI